MHVTQAKVSRPRFYVNCRFGYLPLSLDLCLAVIRVIPRIADPKKMNIDDLGDIVINALIWFCAKFSIYKCFEIGGCKNR